MSVSKTAKHERIIVLDLLRGFSLFGIIIANMLVFHSPYLYIDPYSYFTSPSDQTTFKWIVIFIQGSFYPIFAFLFGYGLNMQYEKAVKAGKPYKPFMAKRLSLLLVFGVLHALLLWSGDILFTYAIIGFLVMLLLPLSRKWLLSLAFALYFIPTMGLYLLTKLVEVAAGLSIESLTEQSLVTQALEIYGRGTYGDIFSFRAYEWLITGVLNTFLVGFIIGGIMLFGVVCSKGQLIERATARKRALLLSGLLLTGIGILLKSWPFITSPTYSNIQLQTTLGGTVLAAGYIGLFLYITTSNKLAGFLSPLANAGRMSFTIYIMQTVIATTLFYSYGFGLYGQVDLWTGTVIATGIYLAQLVFATIWFKKYTQGPLEALWRIGIYGLKK